MVLGQRIYEREKEKQINLGNDLIDKEFQTKLQNLNIEQKITISAKTNEARLKRMKARNECIEDLRESAR
jgi:beta-lactamase class D